ncbi:hypothetical protein A3K63_00475 [Candidatus Micrarchaeota archaeon RBG_16_49_10]|nr:MAG: hypothetical protein A3K63_00475 [Candidatus Micrarchaeota archaeon RBG_16_49_10]
MSLDKISEYQKAFDERHFKNWNESADKLEFLQSMVVALVGEIGEFANVVKKAVREKKTLGNEVSGEVLGKLREELTDCFIYIVILANRLGMDLEKEYYRKMKVNEKRFEKYRVG